METNFEIEKLWEGTVRLDNTFDNHVTNIHDLSNSKQLTIQDMKYQHSIGARIDGVANWTELNKPILISIDQKEIKDHMKCSAGYFYSNIEKTKGVFRKKTFTEKQYHGFIFRLEPTSDVPKSAPCLASYHARIGRDNAFSVHNKGHVAFFSGSQSAMYSDTSAYFSITSVLVASDENPFKAIVRKKGKTYHMECTSSGIKETLQDLGDEPKTEKKQKSAQDPLQILKVRLAKGEITKEEYEDLKSALE